MTNKIYAKHFDFTAANFKSSKDRERFEEFACLTLQAGNMEYCCITPSLNEKTGELMSFIVDMPKANKILEERGK